MPTTGRAGFSSVTTLAGAQRVNATGLYFAQQDLGGKVAALISAVTAMQAALVSAANSGVTFSAFSTAPTTIANFSTT